MRRGTRWIFFLKATAASLQPSAALGCRLTTWIHCRGLRFSTLAFACPVAEHKIACFVRWNLLQPTNGPEKKNAEIWHWLDSSLWTFLEKRFSLTSK
uniref:Putative secreted protein n=1 Tax=Ixodes ricinus TaxID=34613 RepID=A0A6B0UDU3_IXORI